MWRQTIWESEERRHGDEACHEWMKIVIKYANWPFKVTTECTNSLLASSWIGYKRSPPPATSRTVLYGWWTVDDESRILNSSSDFSYIENHKFVWGVCVRCWLMAKLMVPGKFFFNFSFSLSSVCSAHCVCHDILVVKRKWWSRLEFTRKFCGRHQQPAWSPPLAVFREIKQT